MKQWQSALLKANNMKRCGAMTRNAKACKSPAMKNGRCRMHGGKSTGAPRGERHGRYKHGVFTKESLNMKIYLSHLTKEASSAIKKVESFL